jgi:hypothetical protein
VTSRFDFTEVHHLISWGLSCLFILVFHPPKLLNGLQVNLKWVHIKNSRTNLVLVHIGGI